MYTWVGIQDMGKEPGESMQWGRITTPVQDLIEYRYDVGLPVFITTNLTAEQIREKYQERTASRLNDMVVNHDRPKPVECPVERGLPITGGAT